MTDGPLRLRVLLQERHWQTYRIFSAEYDKAARKIDPDLAGFGPSKAQFHRWLAREIKGLPYPDHCRVLEQMFPGWTAARLFEVVNGDDAVGGSGRSAGSGSVAATVGGSRVGAGTGAGGAVGGGQSAVAVVDPGGIGGLDEWGAGFAGEIVGLSMEIDIDIQADGWSRLINRHEIVNLSDRPLTKVPRELWFENTRPPISVEPESAGKHRVIIQRVHETANLIKFACQISPPLMPGEAAVVAFVAEGGQFVEDHYWRQAITRPLQRYEIKIRHRGAGKLLRCAAVEEHADGSEHSADSGLVWDYDGEDVLIDLKAEHLRANQAVTVRWDVPHERA